MGGKRYKTFCERQQQIPYGDDNKKGKGSYQSTADAKVTARHGEA